MDRGDTRLGEAEEKIFYFDNQPMPIEGDGGWRMTDRGWETKVNGR